MKGFVGGFVAGLAAAAILAGGALLIGNLEVDSSAPSGVRVPNLVGNPVNEAKAKIQALGLAAHQVERSFCFGASVQNQTPDAGSRVVPDATVTLFVGC